MASSVLNVSTARSKDRVVEHPHGTSWPKPYIPASFKGTRSLWSTEWVLASCPFLLTWELCPQSMQGQG